MNCDYPMVSIVVVNARGTVNLRRCLNSLFETEYSNFEVIVVDCLTHGIEEMLKSEFPKARIVHLDYDCGPAEQHNIGYRMSDPESKYIAFLDNDTEVTSGWLINLLTTLNSDETVGVLQPKLLFLNSKKRIDGSGDFMDYVGNTYSRGRFEIDLGQYDSKPEIFSARGAAFITRKETYERSGGFDRDFFIYLDDVDFGWRARLAGYRILFAPDSIVFHGGGITAKGLHHLRLFHHKKNQLAMIIKNYASKNLLNFGFQRIAVDLRRIMSTTLSRKLDEAKAYARAVLWVLSRFRDIYKKRLEIQNSIRQIPDKLVMESMQKPKEPFLIYLLPFRRFLLGSRGSK